MRTVMRFLVCAGLMGAAVAAHAQFRYTCTINGRTVNSNSPCPSTTAPTYYGPPPAERASTYTPPPPRVEDAPREMKYLSAKCSSLNDALRTASSRGLKFETIETMRKNYDAECREEEQEARERLSSEKYSKVKQRREEEVESRKVQERTALERQQCGESKRILIAKRARTDLTEGEKADLQRFEDNYKSRCG